MTFTEQDRGAKHQADSPGYETQRSRNIDNTNRRQAA